MKRDFEYDIKRYKYGVENYYRLTFELIDILMIRDEIMTPDLSPEQKRFVREVDRELVEFADGFFERLEEWFDVKTDRKDEKIPKTRWWWWLDLVASGELKPKLED